MSVTEGLASSQRRVWGQLCARLWVSGEEQYPVLALADGTALSQEGGHIIV